MFMIQWWVNACISRNIWTIFQLFQRSIAHTESTSSHISVHAGYGCAQISESNSSVWKLTFPEGILCFSAVADPEDFPLSYPSLGCGCSTCREVNEQISPDMGPLGIGNTLQHFSSHNDIHQPGSVSMSTQGCAGGCMVSALTPAICFLYCSDLLFWSCFINSSTCDTQRKEISVHRDPSHSGFRDLGRIQTPLRPRVFMVWVSWGWEGGKFGKLFIWPQGLRWKSLVGIKELGTGGKVHLGLFSLRWFSE